MNCDLVSMLARPVAFHRVFVEIGCGITGSLLLSQALYWTERTSDPDGWFWKTGEEWTDETGMTRFEQEGARAKLKKLGLIEEKRKGIPGKMHYRVDLSRLSDLLGVSQTTMRKSRKLQCGNPANSDAEIPQCNTETTTETTTESGADAPVRKPGSRFKPPAVAEVVAYCEERGNGIDAQHFRDYYEARGWKLRGGQPMKCWKATVRTWERNGSGTSRTQSGVRTLPDGRKFYDGMEII